MPILGVVQLYWVGASHTGRYARLTSLGLNAMYVLLRALSTTNASMRVAYHMTDRARMLSSKQEQ